MRPYLRRQSIDSNRQRGVTVHVPTWAPRNSYAFPQAEALLGQIAHEAKGRIMEGQTDRDVLVWVLNQISTDEVIL